jgi:hypothetical protein
MLRAAVYFDHLVGFRTISIGPQESKENWRRFGTKFETRWSVLQLRRTICRYFLLGIKKNKASQVERSGEDLSAKIVVLKECRHVLCDVSDRLNQIYNGQLFVSLSSLFVNVLLNLYFAIFGGFAQPATQHVNAQMLPSVVNSLTWSLYYFLRFAFICATADALVNEV